MLLQVALYLLLMQERYGQVIESGLLWYLSNSHPQQVKLVPQELLSLMQSRNWLAAALMPAQPLPPVIREERACDKCFQKSVCALSHKVCFCARDWENLPTTATSACLRPISEELSDYKGLHSCVSRLCHICITYEVFTLTGTNHWPH